MADKRESIKGKISFIVSLYNFAENVEALYQDSKKTLDRIGDPYEMVFVDDGSDDGTYEKLMRISKKDESVRIVKMRSTFGEACTLDAGLNYSDGERIVFLSGRVKVNPGEISNLLQKLSEGNDLVVGWRYPRKDSILNRWVSYMFNKLVSTISKNRLHDINSGVIVTFRDVFEKICYYGDLYNFIPVLAIQQGYKVREEKIQQQPGSFRTSRYPREYLRRMLDIITVFFLTRYSKKPIHFLGFFGALFMICGIGIEIYLFIYRVFLVQPIAGRPLLVLGALLLVIGIQMISIGLIGEMIIFTHAGEIKEYNIEKIID